MAKRKRSRRFGFKGGHMGLIEPALGFGYGFVRKDLAGFATPLINLAAPAGAYADNVALGLTAYAADWFFKPSGVLKDGLKVVVVTEAFQAGGKARGGASMTAPSSSSTGGWK